MHAVGFKRLEDLGKFPHIPRNTYFFVVRQREGMEVAGVNHSNLAALCPQVVLYMAKRRYHPVDLRFPSICRNDDF